MAATTTTVPRKTAQAPHDFVPPFPPAGGIAALTGLAVPVCFFILTPSAGDRRNVRLAAPVGLKLPLAECSLSPLPLLWFLVLSYDLGYPYETPHLIIGRKSGSLHLYHGKRFRRCQEPTADKNLPKPPLGPPLGGFPGRSPTIRIFGFGGSTPLTPASLLVRFARADLLRLNTP